MSDYALELFCGLQIQSIQHRLARYDSLSARAYSEPRDPQLFRDPGGFCQRCEDEAIPGQRLCARHSAIRRQGQERRRLKRIAEGLCLRCPYPVVPGRRMCALHLSRASSRVRAVYHRRRAA